MLKITLPQLIQRINDINIILGKYNIPLISLLNLETVDPDEFLNQITDDLAVLQSAVLANDDDIVIRAILDYSNKGYINKATINSNWQSIIGASTSLVSADKIILKVYQGLSNDDIDPLGYLANMDITVVMTYYDELIDNFIYYKVNKKTLISSDALSLSIELNYEDFEAFKGYENELINVTYGFTFEQEVTTFPMSLYALAQLDTSVDNKDESDVYAQYVFCRQPFNMYINNKLFFLSPYIDKYEDYISNVNYNGRFKYDNSRIENTVLTFKSSEPLFTCIKAIGMDVGSN